MVVDHREQLPTKLKSNVFSRLPVDSLLRFRCLSKTWCAIIDGPFFKRLHTKRLLLSLHDHPQQQDCDDSASPVTLFHIGTRISDRFIEAPADRVKRKFCYGYLYHDDGDGRKSLRRYHPSKKWGRKRLVINDNISYKIRESFRCRFDLPWGINCIVGSCNGLVCMVINDMSNYRDPKPQLMITNPVTREWLPLPRIRRATVIMSGFGYHHSTGEYKVVCIYTKWNAFRTRKIAVYKLGSGYWKEISTGEEREPVACSVLLECRTMFQLEEPLRYHNSASGALFNGALHWIDNKGQVVQFDLVTEELRSCFPALSAMTSPGTSGQRLVVWNGMLCATFCKVNSLRLRRMEVWIMRNGAWSREFGIRMSNPMDDYKFITFTKSTQKAILCFNGITLVSYDTLSEEFSVLVTDDHRHKLFRFKSTPPIRHIKSFVSLRSLGEDTLRFSNRPSFSILKTFQAFIRFIKQNVF